MGLSCFKSWKQDSRGHKGNRDVLASPGSYFFLSNSAGQGDEWLKSLNKGVWIPFTGVFGQSLEETVLYERRYGVRLVPLVVEQCVTFIRDHGLREVGLFRQPGQASLVRELQEAFDAGERPSFDSGTDVHTVASLLKLYLRQLPEPLVPYGRYQEFLLCGRRLLSDRTPGLGDLRNLLCELPFANFNLLKFICQFLNEVQSHTISNRMSGQNLATVFGPNILRAKAEDPQSIMGGAALVQVLMLELIREHASLFVEIPSPASARLPGGSHASPGALRHPRLHPPPCLRQLSLPLITERSREAGQPAVDERNPSSACFAAIQSDVSSGQKRHLGHRHTSSHPENCFYPLPSSSQHQADVDRHQPPAKVPASTSLQPQDTLPDTSQPRSTLLGWEHGQPGPGEGGLGLWSAGAADAEGAAPEAASGDSSEVQEDSTLSAYDNLHSATQCETTEAIAPEHADGSAALSGICEELKPEGAEQARGSSSSWSSCEVLPLDESDDAAAALSPDTVSERYRRLSSSQEAQEGGGSSDGQEDCDEEDDEDEDILHPNSPESCSVLSDSPLSTGSSDVFLPCSPPHVQGPEPRPRPRDPHSLLAELQQEMVQQRAEYQARIQRLERCNDALKRQVAVLRIGLERQRRSQSVAEVKIRNMERAKAEADLRNTALQREMELFFQMQRGLRRRGGGRGGASL